jgi:hypothetical protein
METKLIREIKNLKNETFKKSKLISKMLKFY